MKSIKDDRNGRSDTISCLRFCGMIVLGLLLFSMNAVSGFGQAADPFSIGAGQSVQAPASFGAPAPVAPPAPASVQPPAPASVQPPAPASVQPPAVPANPQLPPASAPAPAPAAVKPQVGAPAPLSTPPLTEPPKKPGPKSHPPKLPQPKPSAADEAKVPPTMSPTALRNYTQVRRDMNSGRDPSETHWKQNPQLLRSVPTPGHPLIGYLDLPAPDSLIKGKPLSIAELLDGVRNTASRRQLLHTYWEMVGKLAEYNCRLQAEQQAGGGNRDAQFNQAMNLLRQQRRAAEVDFVKSQHQLAELLKRHKGASPAEEELPIPNEFPLVKKYETHADKIARSERSRYVARVIPVQEQLLHARSLACRETFEIHKTIPPNSQQLLLMLQQRTEAFLDMTGAVVEYNQMIAEYASETIPSGASPYKLVGALVELPKFEPKDPAPRQNQQMAAPGAPKFSAAPVAPPEAASPETAPPETVQKLPEAPESVYAAQPKPIAEDRETPATPFFRVGDEQPPRIPGQRRRGHPDVTPAAFESVAAPQTPIMQASHVEEPMEPKPLSPPD